MKAIAVLPPDLLAHVRSHLPAALMPIESTLDAAQRALNASSGGLLVVDPNDIHPDVFDALVRAAARSGTHVLVYGRLSPVFAGGVASAAGIMLVDLAIAGAEDDRPLRRCLADAATTISMRARVIQGIADRVNRVQTPIRTPVVGLFAGASISTLAEDFYQAESLDSSATLDRLRRAGLAGIHDLLIGARLSAAWLGLRDFSVTLEHIAQRYGFGTVRTLTNNCTRFTGLPPRKAARRLSPEEFASRVVARLQPAPAANNR